MISKRTTIPKQINSKTYTNETFLLKGVKTCHKGDNVVILRLPKIANVVGRFLLSYEEELITSCTSVDYTTLWAILDDMEHYKPKRRNFKEKELSIETLLNQCEGTKTCNTVYYCHSITDDPGNAGKKNLKRKEEMLKENRKRMRLEKDSSEGEELRSLEEDHHEIQHIKKETVVDDRKTDDFTVRI